MINSKNIRDISLWEKVFPAALVPSHIFGDNQGSTEFHEEITNRFLGKVWRDVSLNDWLCTANVITIRYYMTPKAFHYYLPSLLFYVVDEKDNYLDWALDALLPVNAKRIAKGDWWFSYVEEFSREQSLFISSYLRYFDSITSDDDGNKNLLRVAINNFWLTVPQPNVQ